jgi:pyruvate kinase
MTTRTKIVATIGPASRSPETLRQLIDAGVSVFRLNFSHGTHDEHSAVLAAIRAASRDADREVAVLQDLCGPKMRLDPVPGDVLDCRQDDEFELVSHPAAGGSGRELSCSYRELPNDLKPGEDVLFADGTVAMQVAGTTPGRARLIVTQPGRLRSRQGLNLPRSNLAVRSLTEKDLADLDWTAQHKHDVDFVGLSFARSADDVVRLRRELESRGCKAQVVVKVERPQAVEQIEEIVAATDAVMVARGDLGVEIDLHRVPAVQKRVIALCNAAHRPVITATQMLNSMEHSRRPTRAEASDVFNAVLDGTDAVMLSGETAVGEFPVQAVATMRDICVEAERYVKGTGHRPGGASSFGVIDELTAASVNAAYQMSEQLNAAVIAVDTDSGRTALALSNRRPAATILALPRSQRVARRLSLCWGVTPVVLSDPSWVERVLTVGIDWARKHGLAESGRHAVLLRGRIEGRDDVRAVLAGTIR